MRPRSAWLDACVFALCRPGVTIALAEGANAHAVIEAQPVESLVRDWPFAGERMLAMQALVDLARAWTFEQDRNGHTR